MKSRAESLQQHCTVQLQGFLSNREGKIGIGVRVRESLHSDEMAWRSREWIARNVVSGMVEADFISEEES